MTGIAVELRQVLTRRIEQSNEGEIATIVSALCHHDALMTPERAAPVTLIPVRERFSDSSEGCVLDRSTGLTWSKDNVPGGRMNWVKAKEACAALRLGGFSDWRLPTVQELLTLVDYERHDPAIDTEHFACESAWYWTATPAHSSPGAFAWFVYFYHGGSRWGNQGLDAHVRAVRASQ